MLTYRGPMPRAHGYVMVGSELQLSCMRKYQSTCAVFISRPSAAPQQCLEVLEEPWDDNERRRTTQESTALQHDSTLR